MHLSAGEIRGPVLQSLDKRDASSFSIGRSCGLPGCREKLNDDGSMKRWWGANF
jgi:hypothetical protein